MPGTAVFLTSDPQSAPTALLHSLKHYKVLHEQNVILSVVTAPQPTVPDKRARADGADQRPVHAGDADLRLHGAAEHPEGAGDLPQAGLEVRHHDDLVLPVAALAEASPNSGMPIWQDKLFIGLATPRPDATEYFQIPTGRVVEIGTQVTI